MQPEIFSQNNWKRPTDVPFPKIWHKFSAKSKSGEIYKIRIQDMISDQYSEVWDIFKTYFYPEENVHKTLNILADEESMLSEKVIFDGIINQNLSLVAVLDNEDSKPTIVGCLLLVVVNKNDPPFPTLPGVAVSKLDNIFDSLREGVDAFARIGSENLIKEFGLVVKSEYRRLNIGTELFKTMERMGKIFDIPAAIVMLGDAPVQTLSAKLELAVLKELKLNEIVDKNGQKIFPTIGSSVIQYGYFEYF